MALSTPTLGGTDYVTRIQALFDMANNGNYPFPATQVPSADANTLDDYEEGTWTPSLGGTATYSVQSGRYTKIGRLVTYTWQITVNSIGTGSASTVSGLPFTSAVVSACYVGFFASSATNYTFVTGYVSSSATAITMHAIAAAGASSSTATLFGNSTNVAGGGHFTV